MRAVYQSATLIFLNKLAIVGLVLFLAACAQTSPQFEQPITSASDGLSAQDIFDATFLQHGGEHLDELSDVNVAVDGDWYYLITKIQPEVTDEAFRQQSEERILLNPSAYAVVYTGEAGTKQVYRTQQDIEIAYNGVANTDERKQTATALTADAFYIFTLGPLTLSHQVKTWRRLPDIKEKGRSYYRINGELKPGIGLSQSDFITLWVDQETNLSFRVHITLEGFESTKGAHVDTTFLNYTMLNQFTLPTHFFERVIGPIGIDAHEWWYTGIDINRGLTLNDVRLGQWSQKASKPAEPFDGKSND